MNGDYVSYLVYIIGFLIMLPVVFLVLKGSRLDECFKKGKVGEIKIAYLLISIIVAHLFMSAFQHICNFFLSN